MSNEELKYVCQECGKVGMLVIATNSARSLSDLDRKWLELLHGHQEQFPEEDIVNFTTGHCKVGCDLHATVTIWSRPKQPEFKVGDGFLDPSRNTLWMVNQLNQDGNMTCVCLDVDHHVREKVIHRDKCNHIPNAELLALAASRAKEGK